MAMNGTARSAGRPARSPGSPNMPTTRRGLPPRTPASSGFRPNTLSKPALVKGAERGRFGHTSIGLVRLLLHCKITLVETTPNRVQENYGSSLRPKPGDLTLLPTSFTLRGNVAARSSPQGLG